MTPDERADIAKAHRTAGEARYCVGCGQPWPCDARRILDADAEIAAFARASLTKSTGSAVVIEAEDMR